MADPIIVGMTGAEMRAMREFLGFPPALLARLLGVGERKLTRWEDEDLPIPDGVAGEMDDFWEEAATFVRRWTLKYRELMDVAEGDVEIVTYRTDDEYWRATNQKGIGVDRYPSRWHRMLCQRVAENVPGLVLVYG